MASNKPFDRRLRISNTHVENKAWDPDDQTGSGSGSGGTATDTNKVLTFAVSGMLQPGLQGVNSRVPITGKVSSVNMSLVQASTTEFTFDVQVCKATDYVSTQVWNSVLAAPKTVTIGSLAASGSLGLTDVSAGDYMRVVLLSTPTGAIGLCMEVEVGVV